MIREQFRKEYSRFRDEPADYTIDKLNNPVVYDAEGILKKERRKGKRCDDFVLFDISDKTAGIYIVERKSKMMDVDGVTGQLKGGASFMQDCMPAGQSFDFLPVLVAIKFDRLFLKKLKKQTVTIRGSTKKIEFIKARDELPSI